MLSTMNRVIRHLAAGGSLATVLMSLTACAEGAPPQGAAFPAAQSSARASGWIDSSTSTEATMLAQNDVSTTGAPSAPQPAPQPLPQPSDTSGPLPPLDGNAQPPQSAEPAAASEYDVAADTDPAAL